MRCLLQYQETPPDGAWTTVVDGDPVVYPNEGYAGTAAQTLTDDSVADRFRAIDAEDEETVLVVWSREAGSTKQLIDEARFAGYRQTDMEGGPGYSRS